MMKEPQHIMVFNLCPDKFSTMRSTTQAAREKQMLLAKVTDGGKS